MIRPAIAALAFCLVGAPASAAVPDAAYYCFNPKTKLGFSLTYQVHGKSISNVSIHAFGTPRPGPDIDTHWKGIAAGDAVEFSYSEVWRGLNVFGTMTLKPAVEPRSFKLNWQTKYSTGRTEFGDESGQADCVKQDTSTGGAKPQ
ncbi:MAG: hypothetical protein KGZ65_04770 [Sphingomonadales bacterium]|nr:hypothetical protein [Sphingomonadales bacterium]